MRSRLERILLLLLLGSSVLLGLCFWLNTIFSFNLFNKEHWSELSRLQAEQIPISSGFYTSIGIAIFIFVFGLGVIYAPVIKRSYQKIVHMQNQSLAFPQLTHEKDKMVKRPEPEKFDMPARPPKLNLPSNMAQIAKQHHENNNVNKPVSQDSSSPRYDSDIAQTFTDAGYVVKPNPIISGFTPNLFAIAPDEILWIGGVDKDIDKLQHAINRLQSVFQETLEDIKININAFMIDTTGQQRPTNSIFVFKSLDELKEFVSELPPVWPKEMTNSDQENFDAYSEYIDTIIQYIKNMG